MTEIAAGRQLRPDAFPDPPLVRGMDEFRFWARHRHRP